MSSVIGIFLAMFLIGAAAFAPLGYFIYQYTQKSGKPFGETEPHGDSPSAVNEFAEKVISLVKKKTAKIENDGIK